MDIDNPAFAPDAYVSSLLQYKSLEQLVARGNDMVSEIKSLDSDMQMLVYENYSKFISATDTIREMRGRVEGMETQMSELEANFGKIAATSDAVNSSFSSRRIELEKLNGVKRNLAKLQFLMDLPASLQQCVDAKEYVLAVRCHLKASKLLAAVGHVASFEGIRSEAAAIMRTLSSHLTKRLSHDDLSTDELSQCVWLLLRLDGNEEALLREFLHRRRQGVHELIATFSPFAAAATMHEEAAAKVDEATLNSLAAAQEAAGGLELADAAADDDDDQPEQGPAAYVRQLGERVVPQLLQLHAAWHTLFDHADGSGTSAAPPIDADKKEAMLLEAASEIGATFIDAARRRLCEPEVNSHQLLVGLSELLTSLEPVNAVLPTAKLHARATRVAEALARRGLDAEFAALQARLSNAAVTLIDGTAGSERGVASAAVATAVRETLHQATPLLAPLCDMIGLHADGMALHLVTRLLLALQHMRDEMLKPRAAARAVLRAAGICLDMSAKGIPQVPDVLRTQLSPHGLGGAALGFDHGALAKEFAGAADALLQRFVEMQAQGLSLVISRRLRGGDWLRSATPKGVSSLVSELIRELNAMGKVAVELFHGEVARPLLPQGPFPPPSARSAALSAPHIGNSRHAIQTDMQRLFARKISLDSLSADSGGGHTNLASMVAHVTKLSLKTLLEEVRCATFSRSGAQQMQVDMAMLRWVLPTAVQDSASVVSLLDEIDISIHERALEFAPLEHAVCEAFCIDMRQQLLS